ncbi:MAG: hypothetical protein M1320_00410 [Patescibacteria group bacterium]|nr:hypothetical protein [Patescibacteria group bacterium]
MSNFNPYIRSILIGIILCSVVGGVLFTAPQRAQAFLGIGDINFDPTNWAEKVWEWAQQTAKWIADQMYPVLRDAVVKRIVDDMTDQIVQSIENGGKPLFVTNLGEYTKRATDIAFDTFNNTLSSQAGLDLCAPFQSQLQMYFNVNLGSAGRYPLGIPTRCSFDQFKQNIQNTGTFIQSGGWIGMQQLFLPSNNLLGASISLESAYYSKIADEQQKRNMEYQAGKGFLSVKQCVQYESPISGQLVDETQFRADATQACNDVGRTDTDQCVSEFADSYCRKQDTKTPGDIVAQSATQATLKDFSYVQNVQSILSSLVNVFIKNVFDKTKGLIFASTSHGNALASNTLDYSGKIVTNNTISDRWKEAQRTLNNINVNYIRVSSFINKNLLPQIRSGRMYAVQAIYTCYMGVSGKSYDSPPYGWLNYVLGNNIKYQAALSTLISMPIGATPPAGFDLPGEPDIMSLLKRNPNFETAGLLNKRSFPPVVASSTPFEEGYFERTLRSLKAAQSDLAQNQTNLTAFMNSLNAISTTTTTTATQIDTNGKPQQVVVDNVASSTTALSNLMNNANTQYNDFIQKYKAFVSDVIEGEQSGVGPGKMGGGSTTSDVFSAVNDALMRPDDLGAPHGENYYYCEYRS